MPWHISRDQAYPLTFCWTWLCKLNSLKLLSRNEEQKNGKLDASSYTLAVLTNLFWKQLTRNVYGISDEVLLLPVQQHQHFPISSRNTGSLIAFVFYTAHWFGGS